MNDKDLVYQFKITLKEIKHVWRRIQVPTNYTFWDLHVAIQDSMGWLDYHLHRFSIKRKHAHKMTDIGIPYDKEFDDDIEILPGWEIDVSRYFSDIGVSALYVYDFGDEWKHHILLEGIIIKEKGIKYPRCIDGGGKCPPEDCGGVRGYYAFLEAVSNPDHEEHQRMIEWYGEEFDPTDFNPQEVQFDNPRKRWRKAFQSG